MRRPKKNKRNENIKNYLRTFNTFTNIIHSNLLPAKKQEGSHRKQENKINSSQPKVGRGNIWPVKSLEDYETEGIVVWVKGTVGEVICERNMASCYAHFYFNDNTEIDGNTIKQADRLGIFQLQSGSKIEFECQYLPPEQNENVYLVHIKKMSLIKKESKTATISISMLHSSSNPFENKWALNDGGEYVRISPIVFSKDWFLESLNINGCASYYISMDKEEYRAGCTFLGKVMKTPRWMQENKNSRYFLLNVEEKCERISGQATIVHVIAGQSAILIADSRQNEPMYYPIVAYPTAYKKRIVKGARVDFMASKELPGFTYFWRVEAINLLPPGTISNALREYRAVDKEKSIELTKKASEVIVKTSNTEENQEVAEDITEIVQEEEDNGADSDISETNEENPSHEMLEMLGCSLRDIDEGEEVERVQTHHNLAVEYNHHTMTIADKVAEEQRKYREKRRREEEEEYAERDEEEITEMEKEVRGYYGLPMEKIPMPEIKSKKKKSAAEIFILLEPLEGIDVIGLYDDVRLSFEHILLENEERKHLDKEKEKKAARTLPQQATSETESTTKKSSDGWWFQRKTPRLYPTYIVAEICANRTMKEFCRNYRTNQLMETIVIRKNAV